MKKYIWLLLIAVLLFGTSAVLAASVTPTVIPGASNTDKTCAVVLPGSTELKIEPVPDGTYSSNDGMLAVNIVKPSVGATSINSFDWTSNIPVSVVIVKNGNDGANKYDYTADPVKGDNYLTTPFDGDKGISHISFCYFPVQYKELKVKKTAEGTYERKIEWSLDKMVDVASHTGTAGLEAGSSTWKVVADKTETIGNYQVTGSIEIYNPNSYEVPFSVIDMLNDGTYASVSCPAYTVPAGATLTCTYTAAPPDKSATKNKVVVTPDDKMIPGGSDTVDILWTEKVSGYGEGTLSDARFGYEKLISDDTTVEFPETFVCPADVALYKEGKYTYKVTNEAVLNDKIGLKDSADVTVECTLPALQVKKDAFGTYDRIIKWLLKKTVDDAYHSGFAGETAGNSIWEVVATKMVSYANYKVTGTITITNPAAVPQTFEIQDMLSDGTAAAVTCDTTTVPAGGSVTCSYTAAPASKAAFNNVAIKALGNKAQTYRATIEWTEKVYGYESGTLSDPRFSYSEEISASKTVTFPEEFICPADASLYKYGKYSFYQKNTAILNGNIGLTAYAKVKIDCTLPALKVSKDANATYERKVTWKLDKSVDVNYYKGLFGQTLGTSIWTVIADKTVTIGNYKVTGTITIENPASIPQTFTVKDWLNDGTNAEVTCPAYTVLANDTVVCTYVAYPADASATKNTAKVTAPGNLPKYAYADFTFQEILIGFDSGTLKDPRFGYEAVISDDTTVTFPEEFVCSQNPKEYTDGKLTKTVTNWAYLNGNIGLSDYATVKLECYWNGRTPGYWKNHTKPGEWPAGYLPGDYVTSVFAFPPQLLTPTGILDLNGDKKNDTLLDALSYKGGSTLAGKAQIFLRAATAALLNEAYFGAAYPPYASVADLVAAVNDVLDDLDGNAYVNMGAILDWFNNGVH